jgi:hypothetical protein
MVNRNCIDIAGNAVTFSDDIGTAAMDCAKRRPARLVQPAMPAGRVVAGQGYLSMPAPIVGKFYIPDHAGSLICSLMLI